MRCDRRSSDLYARLSFRLNLKRGGDLNGLPRTSLLQDFTAATSRDSEVSYFDDQLLELLAGTGFQHLSHESSDRCSLALRCHPAFCSICTSHHCAAKRLANDTGPFAQLMANSGRQPQRALRWAASCASSCFSCLFLRLNSRA